jgi:hypothetical protein
MMALSKSKIQLLKLHEIWGKLQHVRLIAPLIRGFMTLINCAMVCCGHHRHIRLGHQSELCLVLQHICFLLEELRSWLTHICELVPPYLPPIYGWNDSCALVGAGGILLPCTYWVPPMVWFIEYFVMGRTSKASWSMMAKWQLHYSKTLSLNSWHHPSSCLASCFYCNNMSDYYVSA